MYNLQIIPALIPFVKATATSAIMGAEVFVTDENDKSFALAVDKTPKTIEIKNLLDQIRK